MSMARVGRIRMKAGGADVRILPTVERSEMAQALIAQAANAAKDPRPIVAYALVAMYDDAAFSSHARTHFGDMPFNRYAFIGMVTEAVRDDLITYETARGVVNKANGWEE